MARHRASELRGSTVQLSDCRGRKSTSTSMTAAVIPPASCRELHYCPKVVLQVGGFQISAVETIPE
jgi:hypothetical protein